MAFISFNLPNGCGEKIGFSITILLALVLNLCLIGVYIPHSSLSFPLIGEFFLGGIIIVGASVIQSVMILLMHYSSERPQAPSKMLKVIALTYLSKVTFTSLQGLEGDPGLNEDSSAGSEEEKPAASSNNDKNTEIVKKEETKSGEQNEVQESKMDFADAVMVKAAS